ncbi:two-component regulator propeller domain-containing protein [Gelidibacter japonicus]|uniref:ligand-binding sensor domain-containing protein n=1 Tax=Gelidibacter japonicus TaxID=1962232 RepID=UPI002AFE1571|nr:two-component regulator propeller domain-containing protein [Gelidibacter japonicus]
MEKSFSYNSQIRFDELGYAWISGSDGLYKYNGVHFSFIPYTKLFNKETVRNKRYLFEKDTKGNFWLSNLNGELIKFDRHNKTTSFKEKFPPNTSAIDITAINSEADDVWFGSDNGVLYKHTLNTSKVDSIITLPKTKNLSQRILNIVFALPNQYWISTTKGKIYIYSEQDKKLTEVTDILNGSAQHIFLTKDNSGNIWIATESQGLYSYDLKNNTFKHYDQFYDSTSNLKQPFFTNIFCDSYNDIWASSDGDCLYRIKQKNGSIQKFTKEETNKFSITSNTVNELVEDSHKNIWIVTKNGGICIYPNNQANGIKYYNGREDNTPSKVLSILKASDNTIWIGTDGDGLTRVFPNNSKIQYNYTKKDKQYFEGKYIQSLLEDSNGNIWISTYQNGIWVYYKELNTFKKIETPQSDKTQLAHINVLFLDSQKRIWASSQTGITIFSNNYDQLAFFEYNSKGLFGNVAGIISEDELNNVWVGMSRGASINLKRIQTIYIIHILISANIIKKTKRI